MLLNPELKLNYDDVWIVPQRTTLVSRSQVNLERNFKFYHSPKTWSGIPLMCSNMVPLTSKNMALKLSEYKIATALHKYYDAEQLTEIIEAVGTDYAWTTIGKSYEDIEKIKAVSKNLREETNIVIDVPNGYMESFVKFCADVRKEFPESIICAGNVTTPEICEELIIHGKVDICKIQIGPGSQCETRKMTGIGYGTLSCNQECSHAAHGLRSGNGRLGLVMSDGGCKSAGDICKAMCSGSDWVMLGGMFAGTDECNGEWEYEYLNEKNLWEPLLKDKATVDQTRIRKSNLTFYGMSSHYAQVKHGAGKKDYRASEGKVSKIPYRGPVSDVVQEILGGLRSCGAYIGAHKLKDFNRCAKFVRCLT